MASTSTSATSSIRSVTWRGAPLIGPLLDIRRDQLRTFERMAATGDAISFRVLHKRLHLLTHPDHFRHVLVDEAKIYLKRTRGYHFLRKIVGQGLLTSEGEFWLRQRRIAQPAFHRGKIAAFGDAMVRAAETGIASWKDGEVRDVAHDMMQVTLEIVGHTLLSRDLTGEADEVGKALTIGLEHIMHKIQTPWTLPESVPTPGNVRMRRAVATLDRVVAEILAAKRAAPPAEARDLLDMLLAARDEQTGEGMTDVQLRDEVLTILLAGHETTAMNLTWTLWLLACHPEAQARLHAEIDGAVGARAATMADLGALPYSDRVVHESLRLYPPAWAIARAAQADDDACGHPVRAGDWIFLSPWITHRRPDFWPEPARFDPDRFLPEAVERRDRYAWIPFSTGSRKCIGDQFALMEARLVLVTLLQKFRFEPVSADPPKLDALITIRPRGGLPLRVRRRVA